MHGLVAEVCHNIPTLIAELAELFENTFTSSYGRSVWFRIVCIEMLTSSLQGQLTFNEQGDRYIARGEGVLKQFRQLSNQGGYIMTDFCN